GSAQLLADELNEEQREFTRFIVESGQRLLDTLSAILEFAHLDSGGTRAKFEPISLPTTLRRIAEQHLLRARAKGIDLALELRNDEMFVEANPSHFERIIEILLGNAIKFTRVGCVTVILARDDAYALIHVRDTGIGIAPDFLPHLFQEFRQESDGLSRTHEGPGLGLAIARRLVENMHGTISATSTKHVGSTFTVRLPLMPASSPAMAEMRPAANG
ncbi:MAG TPA: HAMP domain-containing sensor histidine kinase, partial [Rhodothermales bacterium]